MERMLPATIPLMNFRYIDLRIAGCLIARIEPEASILRYKVLADAASIFSRQEEFSFGNNVSEIAFV